MMKSFFKKLAFVMALAMVVSMAAPAAAKAYAADMYLAYQKGGAVSELNMKAGSKEDLRFKNAPANWADLTKTWASDNEAVAVVDKNGVVTAIADGTAKVTFTLGDGTAASVTVNVGEAKVYNVTLGNADNKAMTAVELKKDATFDFNFYGIKDWSTSKYSVTWISNAPEVAKVDQKGIVTAVAAGSATVTAAIVNNETGATMNVTPVVVTVPVEKVASTFTVAQTTTTKFAMTFDAKKDVKAEDVEVIMLINDVEAPQLVKSVEVKDNVATVELHSNFTDGLTYKVNYAGETKEFVASVGDIDRVSFTYWSIEEGDNLAYVSTDEDPLITTLEYQLFDANGVDVTAAYDEDDLSVEYALASENDDCEVLDNELTFSAAGAAVVEITVTWFDEEGDEVEKTGNGVVVATKRPALTHSIVKAGFINLEDDPFVEVLADGVAEDMRLAFTKDKDSFFWKDNAFTTKWAYGDEGDFQFAALVKDNRGNEVVTGINNYGEGDKEENKDKEVIYPYGYFKFATSNENIVDIDETGELTFEDAGTASVITYFVDTTGEEEKELFVGATKITVNPERYAKTYALAATSMTVASTTAGASTEAKFTFTVYDQYGENYKLENNGDDVTVETTSKDENVPVKTAKVTFSDDAGCDTWWCGNSKGDCHYHFAFNGSDFKEYLEDLDKGSVSIPYTVTFDKEENDKMTSSETAKIKLVVKDTADDAEKIGSENADKFYFAQAWRNGSSSADAVVNYAKNFKKTNNETAIKIAQVQFKYLASSNGFEMKNVPAENIIDITALAEAKEMPTTGEAGKIYYVVSAPKDAFNKDGSMKNWFYETNYAYAVNDEAVADDANHYTAVFDELGIGEESWNLGVNFYFNDVENGNLKYAKNGTYKLTAYYVKNTSIKEFEDEEGHGLGIMGGKLSKLGTYSITVSNSQINPKFEGYDAELGNKAEEEYSENHTYTDEEILEIVKKNLVFSYDGKEIDWDDTDIEIFFPAPEDEHDIVYKVDNKKIRVNKVTIKVPVEDNKEGTEYTYSKKLEIKKSINWAEEE